MNSVQKQKGHECVRKKKLNRIKMYRKIGATDEKNGRKKKKTSISFIFSIVYRNYYKESIDSLGSSDRSTNQPTSQQHTKTHTHIHIHTKRQECPATNSKIFQTHNNQKRKICFLNTNRIAKKNPR